MHYGQMMMQVTTQEENTNFESGWQQLQKLSFGDDKNLVDTVSDAEVQDELGWEPVVLSQRTCTPVLDPQTRLALADLEDCLFSFLNASLPAHTRPQQTVTSFTEVVIPQFNPRTGRWA